MNNIAQKIKKLRKEKGYSLKKVADFLGVSINIAWKLENGKCNVSLTKLDKISKLFGVSKIYLIGDDEKPNNKKEEFFNKFENLTKKEQRIIKVLMEMLCKGHI